ncbi:hypothetical protein Trydic_g1378 [Trypoxylus dichotomus]
MTDNGSTNIKNTGESPKNKRIVVGALLDMEGAFNYPQTELVVLITDTSISKSTKTLQEVLDMIYPHKAIIPFTRERKLKSFTPLYFSTKDKYLGIVLNKLLFWDPHLYRLTQKYIADFIGRVDDYPSRGYTDCI